MAQVQIIQPYQPQSDALEKVATYCRVSTDSKDQLNSYHTQIGYYTNYIAQHPGWELADIYADEGITGTSLEKRDEFKRMIPKVLQAVAGQDHLVYIYFHDGTVRLYDASPLLEKGGVFAPLRDDAIFRDRLTVLNDTAAWDIEGNRDPAACVDLDPCELYESCPVVEDPLKEAI